MPLFPFPTRPVTDQVGWSYNGTLYCGDHQPDPYLSSLGDRVEPVFLSDVTHDDVCDICGELLEDYTLDDDGLGPDVYRNWADPMYEPEDDTPSLEWPGR